MKSTVLKSSNEVKTFPSISLPPPISNTQKLNFRGQKSTVRRLPGILKTSKPPVIDSSQQDDKDKFSNILIGFTTSNLKLDGTSTVTEKVAFPLENETKEKTLNVIDINKQTKSLDTIRKKNTKQIQATFDETLEELRSYTVLMDQYSLHNFIIYDGHTLRDTPEFVSFKRTYQFDWGSISHVLDKLEELMALYEVKIAIINGPELYELASLKQAFMTDEQLLTCVSNEKQIRPLLRTLKQAKINGYYRAVLKIQTCFRRFVAYRNTKQMRITTAAAITIQCHTRLFLYRLKAKNLKTDLKTAMEKRWKTTCDRFERWWRKAQLEYSERGRAPPEGFREGDSGKQTNLRSSVEALSPVSRPISPSTCPSPLGIGSLTSTFDFMQSQSAYYNSQRRNPRNSSDPPEIDERIINPTLTPNSRLVIFLPSISIPEYLRLHMIDTLQTLENSHLISALYLLADPNIHVAYITPRPFSPMELEYHVKFLELFVRSSEKSDPSCGLTHESSPLHRFHVIVPEMIPNMAPHLSLSQLLLCSADALRKLKYLLRLMPGSLSSSQASQDLATPSAFRGSPTLSLPYSSPSSMLVPSSFDWAEKRIAQYLNVSMYGPGMSPSANYSVPLFQSRSYLKSTLFTAAGVNVPIGAHDINNFEDLLIALSRLISANLDIERWYLRLNNDYNNESCVMLETSSFSLISKLREEQSTIIHTNNNNATAWFTRPVQLAVRNRLIECLRRELKDRCRFCRGDIFRDLAVYLKYLEQFGGVVEAEPIRKLGHVSGLCVFSPPFQQKKIKGGSKGSSNPEAEKPFPNDIQYCGSEELIVDTFGQSQSVIRPQTLCPQSALRGATLAVAQALASKHKIQGHLSVNFCVFWDALDRMPRLWALDIRFGMSNSFGALGLSLITTSNSNSASLTPLPIPPPSNSLPPSPAPPPTTTPTPSIPPQFKLPPSLVSDLPLERSYVYIPLALHPPLKGTRDDVFFKLAKMRGIHYDSKNQIGSLFLLVDNIVSSGSLSVLSLGRSRSQALQSCIQALSFVDQNFGKLKAEDIEESSRCYLMKGILGNLKMLLKAELRISAKQTKHELEKFKNILTTMDPSSSSSSSKPS